MRGESPELIVVVDASLKMPCGKVAAQCVHASLAVLRESKKTQVIRKWRDEGEPVIVLFAQDAEEMEDVFMMAREKALPCAMVRDAGRTCVREGTVTCIGIGPFARNLLDLSFLSSRGV